MRLLAVAATMLVLALPSPAAAQPDAGQIMQSDDAVQGRLMVEVMVRMVNGEPVEIPAVVEEVRVNTGPPRWFDGPDVNTTSEPVPDVRR